jgi:hypothetical protein
MSAPSAGLLLVEVEASEACLVQSVPGLRRCQPGDGAGGWPSACFSSLHQIDEEHVIASLAELSIRGRQCTAVYSRPAILPLAVYQWNSTTKVETRVSSHQLCHCWMDGCSEQCA